MSTAVPELPAVTDQTEFNTNRWEKLCVDQFYANLDHRIETDANGNVIMSPPPAFDHSERQGKILQLLFQHAPDKGSALPESPVSTSGGVKAVDAIWISNDRREKAVKGKLLAIAPEICIEVISPSNTRAEIDEKRRLYFEAGADEVWICGIDSSMRFYIATDPEGKPQPHSPLCPQFPVKI